MEVDLKEADLLEVLLDIFIGSNEDEKEELQ